MEGGIPTTRAISEGLDDEDRHRLDLMRRGIEAPIDRWRAQRLAARLLAAVERAGFDDEGEPARQVSVNVDTIHRLAAALGVTGFTFDGTKFYELDPLPEFDR